MPQRVGNTYAQLLRTITKTGEFNRTTEKIFKIPQYLPINRSYISSINIDIRYPKGDPAKFESKLSNVLVKLHFELLQLLNYLVRTHTKDSAKYALLT